MSNPGATAVAERLAPPSAEPVTPDHDVVHRTLLACGILSVLLYLAMNIFVPLRWPGYSFASQVVSELSAIDAPTRSLWVPFGILYALLTSAFGYGVWITAAGNRPLRVIGAILFAGGLVSATWPPMHMRAVLAAGGGTLTDTLHIVWTAGWGVLLIVAIGFGTAALGKRFALYSFATLVLLIVFGFLTSLEAPRISTDMPTRWIGLWERLNIGIGMLWIAVLSAALLRRRSADDRRRAGGNVR